MAALRSYIWRFAINGIGGSAAIPDRARQVIYRAMGVKIPLHSRISPGVVLTTRRLTIGYRSTINYGCVFDNRASVTVGDRVGIGYGVRFITSSHDTRDPNCRAGAGSVAPIRVGDGCWIGSGVTILGGVSIGAGCVIAAGAVVVRDCEPNTLVGGVPARRIRDLGTLDAGERTSNLGNE